MGEMIKNTGNELKNRWVRKMPRFFRLIVYLATSIATTAVAVNFGVPALGGTLYEWWGELYTHTLVGCISIVMVCKLTVAGGYKKIDADELLRGEIHRHHDYSEMEGEQPVDLE